MDEIPGAVWACGVSVSAGAAVGGAHSSVSSMLIVDCFCLDCFFFLLFFQPSATLSTTLKGGVVGCSFPTTPPPLGVDLGNE